LAAVANETILQLTAQGHQFSEKEAIKMQYNSFSYITNGF